MDSLVGSYKRATAPATTVPRATNASVSLNLEIDGDEETVIFVVAAPEDSGVNAGEVVGELAAKVGGGGGGPADFAQGGGPDADALDDALEAAPDVLRQVANV